MSELIAPIKRISREEFKKQYPDCMSLDKPYSKLIDIEIHDDHIIYTEEIDLTHPECPIIPFKDIA